MAKIKISDIDLVTSEVLLKLCVPEESVKIITDTIHYANRRGVSTHGVGRLPLYAQKIQSGHFNPKNDIEKVIDFAGVAVLDAHGGFGQVAAYEAVKLGVKKAQDFGISMVGVRNSNNFGTAGYFGNMAANLGMAAIIFANSAPAIAPTGGIKPIFGTNPLCFAFPGGENKNPVILDMATTVAARGKIRLAAKNGEKIPDNWALDSEGKPTNDPEEALKGTLLPIAGYKGYGLSTFVDLFAGLLTGSASAGNVKALSKLDEDSGNGHLFVLIDVKRFHDDKELTRKMDDFYNAVRSCGNNGDILLPGERGFNNMARNTEYADISVKQINEINELAEQLGISSRLKEIF